MYLFTSLGFNCDLVVVSVTYKPNLFSLQEMQAILRNQETCLEQPYLENSLEFQQTTAKIASHAFFKGNESKESRDGHTTISRNIREGFRGGCN